MTPGKCTVAVQTEYIYKTQRNLPVKAQCVDGDSFDIFPEAYGCCHKWPLGRLD